MKHKITIFALLLAGLAQASFAQLKVGAETGVVFSGYNDARIPGDGGTMFSLSRELKGNPSIFLRLNADYTLKSRHHFMLLYAPLQTTYRGSVDREILFGNALFAPNTELEAIYKFNSYRFTYRYDIVKRPKFEFGLGLTFKVRDAKIALQSSQIGDESTDLGFVPLVNFHLRWLFADRFSLLFEGDALAAPQGRAEDVLLAATYQITDHLQMYLGYRMLEGGGDNRKVYSFANFNYAAIGLTYTFDFKKK